MNIALTTLNLNAPHAGKRARQLSHQSFYRRGYMKTVRARQARLGKTNAKAKTGLIKTVGMMTQAEVSRALGISRQAVAQIEHRALSKLRAALLPLYLELKH